MGVALATENPEYPDYPDYPGTYGIYGVDGTNEAACLPPSYREGISKHAAWKEKELAVSPPPMLEEEEQHCPEAREARVDPVAGATNRFGHDCRRHAFPPLQEDKCVGLRPFEHADDIHEESIDTGCHIWRGAKGIENLGDRVGGGRVEGDVSPIDIVDADCEVARSIVSDDIVIEVVGRIDDAELEEILGIVEHLLILLGVDVAGFHDLGSRLLLDIDVKQELA